MIPHTKEDALQNIENLYREVRNYEDLKERFINLSKAYESLDHEYGQLLAYWEDTIDIVRDHDKRVAR